MEQVNERIYLSHHISTNTFHLWRDVENGAIVDLTVAQAQRLVSDLLEFLPHTHASFCEAHQPPHESCPCCEAVHAENQRRELEAELAAVAQARDTRPTEAELTSAVDAVSVAAAARAAVTFDTIARLRKGIAESARCLKAWSEFWWFGIMCNHAEALKVRDTLAQQSESLSELAKTEPDEAAVAQARDTLHQLVTRIVTGDGQQLENLDMSDDEWRTAARDRGGPTGGNPEHFEITLDVEDWILLVQHARNESSAGSLGPLRAPRGTTQEEKHEPEDASTRGGKWGAQEADLPRRNDGDT